LVTAEEKKLITEMSATETEAQLARDVAGMMRIWETALVLTETKGDAGRELVKARETNNKLEARLAKAEGDLLDYKGKYEVFVEQSRELRETKEAMAKLEEEVKGLKLQLAAEQKEKENLKSVVNPTADETDATNVFGSRAKLVKEILTLRQDTMDAASYAFANVVEQLKIANPGVNLVTKGTGMLYQVKDGQIVVPEEYQRMADEDGEDKDDDQERQDESEHGEEGV
jgi:capsule polysaccharide export protein KpsE/RkpR